VPGAVGGRLLLIALAALLLAAAVEVDRVGHVAVPAVSQAKLAGSGPMDATRPASFSGSKP
jgi:hypothetical protein